MIVIKNKAAIRKMEVAGEKLSYIFSVLREKIVKAGISTAAIDKAVGILLKEQDLVSRCKGYMGYRHVTCISVNDVVVHGVPSKHDIIQDGDIVKIDICASWKGYCADMARCFFIGTVEQESQKLVAVAQKALDKGIAQAVPGNRVSDISAAVQKEVEKHGYGVVRDFAGHGIGKRLHEEPEVLNYGEPGQGPLLRVGMTLAIEPMITQGSYGVFIDDDGWTVRTNDGSLAAHVEDTVVITEDGPKILTRSHA